MRIEDVGQILGWSLIINYVLLASWFLSFTLFHDWVYSLHGRWFVLDVKTFDALHYFGMAVYKVAIFMFSLGPYIAVQLTI